MEIKFKDTRFLGGVIFAAIAVMVIVPRILSIFYLSAYPTTMIAEDGLIQTKAYLMRFLIIAVICVVLFIVYAVACLYITIRVIRTNGITVKDKICGVIICLFMIFIGFILIPPQSSGMDVQGKRFSQIPIVHTIRLMQAIDKDLQSEPIEVYANTELKLWESKHEIQPGVRRTKAAEISEYELEECEHWKSICQLSEYDHLILKEFLIFHGKYQVVCYPNSGMLYNVVLITDVPDSAIDE